MKKRGLLIVMVCTVLMVWAMSCQAPSSTNSPALSSQAKDSPSGDNTSTDSGAKTQMGFLRLILKDAPADEAKNIYVTISNIRVHEACEGGDDCFQTVWENTAGQEIDLLALEATPLPFPPATIPAGTYNQIRMDIIKGRIIFPSTDPLKPDPEYDLIIPSSEIKTHLHFDLMADQTIKITLDLDAKKSIHIIKKEKKDSYQLRPVVQVVEVGEDAGN